jgi:hypothetical protein
MLGDDFVDDVIAVRSLFAGLGRCLLFHHSHIIANPIQTVNLVCCVFATVADRLIAAVCCVFTTVD